MKLPRLRRGTKATKPRAKGVRLIQFTRALGILFVGGGFAAIGFGWNGMARVTCVDCQLPYLLSGGASGIGLIVLGSTLLLIAQLRAERARVMATLRPPAEPTEAEEPAPEAEPTAELHELGPHRRRAAEAREGS